MSSDYSTVHVPDAVDAEVATDMESCTPADPTIEVFVRVRVGKSTGPRVPAGQDKPEVRGRLSTPAPRWAQLISLYLHVPHFTFAISHIPSAT